MKHSRFSKGLKYTIITSIFWALLIFTNKLILNNGENEFNLIFWTTIISIPYWLIILGKRKDEIKTINKKGIILLILVGVLSTVGVKIFEVLSIKNTTSINFSFLVRTTVIFTIFFEFLILKKPITLKKALLSAIILIGIYLLVVKGQSINLTLGDVFTLIEAMLIALGGNVLGKYVTMLMSSELSASGIFFVGLIPLIILCIILGKISLPLSLPIILVAVFFNIGLNFTRYKALKESTATFYTMVISVTPLWVTLLAVSFLNESMTLIQIIGGLIVMSSVFIVEKLKL